MQKTQGLEALLRPQDSVLVLMYWDVADFATLMGQLIE